MLEDFALDAEVFNNRLIECQLLALRFMGFIFSRTDSFKLFHFNRGIFVMLSLLLLVCSQVRSIWLHSNDFEKIIPVLATSFVYINILARIIAFYCYRKRYISLLTNLQTSLMEILAASSPKEIEIYNSYVEYINKIVYMFLLPISVALVLAFIESVYFIMYQSDGWTVQGQDYMRSLLKQLQSGKKLKFAQQRPELLKDILVNCVEEFSEIKCFAREYEYVSRITLFLESSTISGLLCMQLYIISKDFFSGYGIYQFWCMATIGLLWLYYWHADEISQKSNEITNALYFFNWYDVSLPLQQDIIVFMRATMKPIIIRSSFINMNISTFFMILKTSYSYFTLLRNFAK
ncbi:unnamed protein product [Hermetia illucens]|uniref:Odorant receptor n=1 Tax=Hermetia illucens TaxID=343691 RepID=A0A7R8UBD0_HERIL|nr:unnamed protein product [Hermetia illucens]